MHFCIVLTVCLVICPSISWPAFLTVSSTVFQTCIGCSSKFLFYLLTHRLFLAIWITTSWVLFLTTFSAIFRIWEFCNIIFLLYFPKLYLGTWLETRLPSMLTHFCITPKTLVPLEQLWFSLILLRDFVCFKLDEMNTRMNCIHRLWSHSCFFQVGRLFCNVNQWSVYNFSHPYVHSPVAFCFRTFSYD